MMDRRRLCRGVIYQDELRGGGKKRALSPLIAIKSQDERLNATCVSPYVSLSASDSSQVTSLLEPLRNIDSVNGLEVLLTVEC